MNSIEISGSIVDVVARKIVEGTVIIADGQIVALRPGKVEKNEGYIIPGFVDAHVHIESSMLPPSEFARLAVCHGTVGTVSDPHEIANVLGRPGIQFMIDNANRTVFKFFFGAPSCVPATPFETAGAGISATDIKELLKEGQLTYLSEMMNFPGVLMGLDYINEILEIARQAGVPIDGHAPGLRGEDARKYADQGITTDHECFSEEEALDKIKAGMKILIREGSAAKNYDDLHTLLEKHPDKCMLCSDDKHPDDLAEGHINKLVARAVADGYDIIDVLRAASLNPAQHYGLDIGLLQPGDPADLLVVEDLADFKVKATYINGEKVAENGKSLMQTIEPEPINYFEAMEKQTGDFAIPAKSDRIRVIEALEGQLITGELIEPAKIEDGFAIADEQRDILKIAVINRYEDKAPAMGFIRNFGLKQGAIASSVGHDSHNIIAVGSNDEYLKEAGNAVIRHKGGMAVAGADGTGALALPVAGLMATGDGYEVGRRYRELSEKAKGLGCGLHAPFMTLSFMALLVIPNLKLSDKGLFDGRTFEFTELFVSGE